MSYIYMYVESNQRQFPGHRNPCAEEGHRGGVEEPRHRGASCGERSPQRQGQNRGQHDGATVAPRFFPARNHGDSGPFLQFHNHGDTPKIAGRFVYNG